MHLPWEPEELLGVGVPEGVEARAAWAVVVGYDGGVELELLPLVLELVEVVVVVAGVEMARRAHSLLLPLFHSLRYLACLAGSPVGPVHLQLLPQLLDRLVLYQ